MTDAPAVTTLLDAIERGDEDAYWELRKRDQTRLFDFIRTLVRAAETSERKRCDLLILAREQAAIARTRRETIEEAIDAMWVGIDDYALDVKLGDRKLLGLAAQDRIHELVADRATEGETEGGGR